jgi:hypothetical protein
LGLELELGLGLSGVKWEIPRREFDLEFGIGGVIVTTGESLGSIVEESYRR